MFALATPILLQNLLSSSLNFIDVFMIGRLGESSIAAVGSANQFFFVFLMLIFGLASGTAIFTAQYWGRRDIAGIRATMGIGLTLTMGISLVFMVATMLFPALVISLFTKDPEVIALGSDYLKIIAWCFCIVPLTTSFAVVLRSTENVVFPMYASFAGILLNTGLNYVLIFGHFGFPAMGVIGAAIATLIARSVEMVIVIVITYGRNMPGAARFRDLSGFSFDQFKHYLQRALPVVMQSVGWAGGYSVFSMIYGHISTESLASFNISGSVERICLIFFTGIGAACSIMVGNRIGAGEEDKARGYSQNFILIGLAASVVVSLVLFTLRGYIVDIYQLNDTSRTYMNGILTVISLVLWAKTTNIIMHMGIFKAGGDTLFSMFLDVGGVWLIGIPIVAFAAFYLKLPVHLIVACQAVEEIIKMVIGLRRVISGRWVNNLTSKAAVKPVLQEN